MSVRYNDDFKREVVRAYMAALMITHLWKDSIIHSRVVSIIDLL